MRQRTVSDYFWRDPTICDLSREDKTTLLYFMTSPSSNIIGVYQIVWRIAAAEMGWATEQMMVVSNRLKAMGLIDFNDIGYVWVKIWWKHNSAAGAFSPKLLVKAKKECDSMPKEWLGEFLILLDKTGVDRLLIGYPSCMNIVPLNYNLNTILNTTTTNGSTEDYLDFKFSGLSTIEVASLQMMLNDHNSEMAQSIIDEIAGLKRANLIKKDTISLARTLLNKAVDGKFIPAVGLSIKSIRFRAGTPAHQLRTAAGAESGLQKMHAILAGRQ